jgi:hypothetical protein
VAPLHQGQQVKAAVLTPRHAAGALQTAIESHSRLQKDHPVGSYRQMSQLSARQGCPTRTRQTPANQLQLADWQSPSAVHASPTCACGRQPMPAWQYDPVGHPQSAHASGPTCAHEIGTPSLQVKPGSPNPATHGFRQAFEPSARTPHARPSQSASREHRAVQ